MRRSNILFLTALFFPLFLFSGVNLKNGNFYISYSDHSFEKSGGFDLNRTYNSKSTEVGFFGYGWGTEIETRLFVMGDGSVLIKEHGGGANTFFDAAQTDENAFTAFINELVEAALEKGEISNTPSDINNFKQKMRNSREERANKWRKYLLSALVHPPVLPANVRWSSTNRGSQSIEKTTTGFIRRFTNGTYDLFNEQGFYTGKFNQAGEPVLTMNYNKNGFLEFFLDKMGNRFEFVFNEEGLVASVKSSIGTAFYEYDQQNLIHSTDSRKNSYRYEYDNIHNMTAIRYSDSWSMLIEYYPVNYYVKQITEPSGKKTEYVYVSFYTEDGRINDDHYATYTITKNDYSGTTDSSYVEYEIKVGVNGARYTYRILQRRYGVESETVYDENCQLPVLSRRGSQQVIYKYNQDCKLLLKEDSRNQVTNQYDLVSGKLVRIETVDLQDSTRTVNTFTYTPEGDLLRAEDSDGWVELKYNQQRRIVEMNYEEGTLLFEYNKAGKPVVIELKGGGKLLVTYLSNGEIDKVKSSDNDPQTSLKVSKAFQSLLNRVKPAGARLDL